MNLSLNGQILQLSELSEAMGVLKLNKDGDYSPIKISFSPFESTQQFHNSLGHLCTIWQSLLLKASRNPELILRVYEPIETIDPMITQLMKIFRKKKTMDNDSITFVRCDYYLDEKQQAKLTEYNVMSVGMISHMQQFQLAKSLCDSEHTKQYVISTPTNQYAAAIAEVYCRKVLKGLLLFVVSVKDPNFLDQKRLELQLLAKGIKCKRVTLSDLAQHAKVSENKDLFYLQELVSVVYYRAGYQMKDFTETGMAGKCWQVKTEISLSNAICIPNIAMELINQKRMQAELSKPHVYSSFMSAEDALLIGKSLVGIWELDKLDDSQTKEFVTTLHKRSPDGYILKPNMEGGGNNLYGQAALHKLQQMNAQERKKYILMEKIVTRPIKNIIIQGRKHQSVDCHYQLSRYGLIVQIDSEVLLNKTNGFLIRAKPITENEGGIMMGVGSIVTWKTACSPASHT